MASGLPVVAADLSVHREVCGEAALYFQRFSPEELAEQVLRLEGSHDLRNALAEQGRKRAHEFSWENHVDELLPHATQLTQASSPEYRAIA
jgi:glycosyltransferase involved in cell wall biosynthesis